MPDHWNAAQYLKFKAERTQPSLDLVKQLAGLTPKTILDVGCGPGNSTRVLQKAFPDADILGVDTAEDMLRRAKKEHPDLHFQNQDASKITGQYDLIFSNACLQWVPDHLALLPEWMRHINPGGALAVQIPRNNDEPFFRLIHTLTRQEAWNPTHIEKEREDVPAPAEYYAVLSKCSASCRVWETIYYHHLPDHGALTEWVRGTKLLPYLAALDETTARAFTDALTEQAVPLYPPLPDGGILFPFRRLFFIARR